MCGCKSRTRGTKVFPPSPHTDQVVRPVLREVAAPVRVLTHQSTQTELDVEVPASTQVESPAKRVRETGELPSTSGAKGRKPTMRNKCRVCLEDWAADGQLWVGCSQLSKRGLQTCPMWVHQRCIWLKYPTNAELSQVKVYCPEHQTSDE